LDVPLLENSFDKMTHRHVQSSLSHLTTYHIVSGKQQKIRSFVVIADPADEVGCVGVVMLGEVIHHTSN
jgi:hypothetical protein